MRGPPVDEPSQPPALAERVVVVPEVHHRQRRPTGAPPPLPKKIGMTGVLWLAAVVVIVVSGVIWLHVTTGPLDHLDAPIIRSVTSARSPWLDSLTTKLNSIGSRWGLAILGLLVVTLTAAFRRWRHLVVFLVSLAVLEIILPGLYITAARPRPYSITAIGHWEGFSSPSQPVAALAAVLMGFIYMLVVPGRPRWYAKLAIVAVLVGVALNRIYLGVDHATDLLFAVILGVAIPVALFRAFTPSDVFPVRYGQRGKSAHLDVGGRRGEAIRHAMEEQLGFTILEMKLVGLEGSGGSTPLKLRVTDDQGVERSMFAKLYAKNHVRADRWYKLGRLMLYGRLEDETPFKTVRRFVEYEDYTLRLLGEYGFPTPAPLGIVEITPESEYLIAMEFFDGAVEIGDVDIDEHVIDEGLAMIRRMWDVGLAHRDIKPANLMVQDGHLRLIDVFFVQVRPSPWRQAVDLGNMMLVLALRSDAQTVYEKALGYFTPEELSEAFAATRGVASPTQLRNFMKRDGRDLLEQFRSLVPERRPVTIQRWSFKRIGMIFLTLVVVLAAGAFSLSLFFPSRGDVSTPWCETNRTMILMAQAVPTAEQLPCIRSLPLGWSLAGATIVRGRATFELLVMGGGGGGGPGVQMQLGQGGGSPVVDVTLTPTCPETGEDPAIQTIEVPRACITYRSSLPAGVGPVPSFDPAGGLSYVPRSQLVGFVDQEADLVLCGADAPCS
jgi:membrane-associated phospholipid phosphatase/tRNA A-37 threonylcarbamoyl transferase component Bud32